MKKKFLGYMFLGAIASAAGLVYAGQTCTTYTSCVNNTCIETTVCIKDPEPPALDYPKN